MHLACHGRTGLQHRRTARQQQQRWHEPPTWPRAAAAGPGPPPPAAAAAAEAAAAAPQLSAADCGVQLRRPRRGRRRLHWQRWERRLFEELVAAEQEAALLAPPDSEDYYFSYWDVPDAHLPTLQDGGYQNAWAAALAAAAPWLQGAVVLDVGCGIGALAIAAARAGAKHVYAVDASPGAAELARKLVDANGLAGRVTVLCGRAESVVLPVPRVDIILCDFMGPLLLHDSLLPALTRARDRWLAPDGIMLPDAAQLFVTAFDDRPYLASQSKLWGEAVRLGSGGGGGGALNLRPALAAVVRHPRVDSVAPAQLATDTAQLLSLDLYRAQPKDVAFSARFKLTAPQAAPVSGLAAHFDCQWTMRGRLAGAAAPRFSTSPRAPPSSWLQTLLSFPRQLRLAAGQELAGRIAVKPRGRPLGRMLDVDLELALGGSSASIVYELKR